MDSRKISLCLCLLMVAMLGRSQSAPQYAGYNEDTATVNSLILQGKKHFGDSPEIAFAMLARAQEQSEQIGYLQGQANALKTMGVGYFNQGKFMEAISYWDQA